MIKLSSTVTSSLPKDKLAEFTKRCAGAADVFKHFSDICERKRKESYSTSIKLDKFKDPNWALYQADQQGYQRAMIEIAAILNFNKE